MNPYVKLALDAISRVYGDSSVPVETTIERLESLKDEIEISIEACRADMKKRK